MTWKMSNEDVSLAAVASGRSLGRAPRLVGRSALGRNRTCDQVLRRHLLYPLSYEGATLRPDAERSPPRRYGMQGNSLVRRAPTGSRAVRACLPKSYPLGNSLLTSREDNGRIGSLHPVVCYLLVPSATSRVGDGFGDRGHSGRAVVSPIGWLVAR